MKNFGIRGEELVTDIGANAKMNEFAAIMGLCNLKHIEEAISERKKRYDFYMQNLGDIRGIRFFDRKEEITSNYAYFPIIIEDEYKMNRDELYHYLRENNIYARKYFYPLTSDQACFQNKYKNDKLECARELAQKILIIPFYEKLEMDRMSDIIEMIM